MSKRNLLWSPPRLTTMRRALTWVFLRPLSTYNFPVDNKHLRRKMWAKVVESGREDSGRGQQ